MWTLQGIKKLGMFNLLTRRPLLAARGVNTHYLGRLIPIATRYKQKTVAHAPAPEDGGGRATQCLDVGGPHRHQWCHELSLRPCRVGHSRLDGQQRVGRRLELLVVFSKEIQPPR